MEKIVYLFRKHFMLRIVVTVGLCLIAAVFIGSGLRGPAPTTVPVLDIDQPARLASVKGTGASEQVQNVVSNKATTTQSTTIGSTGNVSSLSQAIKILATKPVNPDADKSVAGASSNTAVVKPADPAIAAQSGAALATKNNNTTSNQTNTAPGR